MKIVVNLWLSSVANSYIQPSLESQFLQYTSLLQNKIFGHIPLNHITSPNHVPSSEHHPILHFTVLEVDHLVEQEGTPGGSGEPWVDIMMIRSIFQWLAVLWTSHLVEISSSLLVRTVSHEAQENRRVPPMCWIKIRPRWGVQVPQCLRLPHLEAASLWHQPANAPDLWPCYFQVRCWSVARCSHLTFFSLGTR